MKRITVILFALGVAIPCLAETITTEDVIRMAKAGLSSETIELKIRYSEPEFDTSTDALIALKEAGVSEETIRMMMEKQRSVSPTPPPPTPVPHPEPAVTVAPLGPIVAPPPPPATPSPVAPATFEVTVRNPSTGAVCSSGFLKVEQKGVAVTGCLGANFTMKWPQIKAVCATGGESTTIRLTTTSGVREISAASADDRDAILAQIVRGAGAGPETCKD